MKICHSSSTPDNGVFNPNVDESITLGQWCAGLGTTPDPANESLRKGDVVGIKCPQLRDHLTSEFCIKDFLGTVHVVYGGSKYQVVLCNSIGNVIYVDCDLEDLSIK